MIGIGTWLTRYGEVKRGYSVLALGLVVILFGITGTYLTSASKAIDSPPSSKSGARLNDAAKPPAAVPPVAPATIRAASIASAAAASWTKLPFYTDPANEAAIYAQANPSADGAALIKRESQVPVAKWFGDWDSDEQAQAGSYAAAAMAAHAVPVMVLYNMPARDCGSYSAGGAANAASYIAWIRQAAAGIGNKPAVIILEPDALAGLDCLSPADQQARYGQLSQAVAILKANPNAAVYVDAGNAAWQPAGTMIARLQSAGIAQADGFSLNVSNFVSTAQSQSYGGQISAGVGGKHYVIDTSRNGNGALASGEWCNPAGMALGTAPTTSTGNALNDALLWVKQPWESDGSCNGAPEAGKVFWPFAVQLAKNAGWQ